MNPERWKQVQELFAQARSRPAAERAAFLRGATSDEELIAEVERLLAAGPAPAFLEPPEEIEAGPGQVLGDFTLLEEIGRGAMGVVYRARQRSLERTVAVKVLPASFALSARQIERFEREARAAARLSHPNVVDIVTVGQSAGVRYFAMEHVAGSNLAEEIERLRAELAATGDEHAHLPSSHAAEYFRTVAELMRQAADGLAHAHAHGVIHRDVKPSNLLLTPEGTLKIVDFGLARDEALGSLSRSGDIMGTPHYMSPEQARAHRHQVDHRTDVYSLGVVLYELLTLRRPFEGKTSHEVLDNLLHREQMPVRKVNPRVPRDLETICSKAMAKEPRQRYSSAGDLRDDLQRFLHHEAILAQAPGPLRLLTRRVARHRGALTILGAVLLAFLSGWFWFAQRAQRAERIEHATMLREALDEGPLAGLPLGRQIELRRRLALLRGESLVHAADGAPLVARAEQAFRELHDELLRRGREELGIARDPARSDTTREIFRLQAIRTLQQAADLFPEDQQLTRLAGQESTYPTLAVRAFDSRGRPVVAEVRVRLADPLTSAVGPARSLGPTPLEPTPLLPGAYRVVVRFSDGSFQEYARDLGPASMDVELSPVQRPRPEPPPGMIAFPATRYTFPQFRCEQSFSGLTVELDAFFMDVAEVSNREYAAFVQATGQAPPRGWAFEDDRESFLERCGDLPVVAVTWNEARAFAEWKGKRLPTAAEWHLAAGGPEGRSLPYSSDPAAPLLGNVRNPSPGVGSARDGWALYLKSASPVHSHPEACTPEGLFHMFGNVYEYTESLAATRGGPGELFLVRSQDRWLYGGAWDGASLEEGMRTPYFQGTGPNDSAFFIGFRCARSAAP